MSTIAEIITNVAIAHGDSRVVCAHELHVNEQTGKKHDHYFLKAGDEVLFKIVVPKPAHLPYSIEEYHEEPGVICGHSVHKAHLLAPMLASLLKESKETAAILERVPKSE